MEPTAVKKAFETIKKAAATGVWSTGVRLSRAANGVAVTKEGDTECECRVSAPNHSVPLTVTIYLGDVEWSCDCMGAMDPCAHVVAAIIALEGQAAGHHLTDDLQRAKAGAATARAGVSAAISPPPELPRRESAGNVGQGHVDTSARAAAVRAPTATRSPERATYGMTFVRGNVRRRRRLGYRFVVEPAGVSLTRFLIGEADAITPLTSPLSSPMSRALVMEIAPREQDLRLDRLIGNAVQKYRVQSTLGAVMTALDGAPNVWLEERAVSVDKEPVMPRVLVSEAPDGFALRFERNPAIDGIPGPGLALVGDVLRPLGEVERTGLKLERLPVAVRYRREQTGELVSKVLPDLERRLVVEYLTDRLPGRTRTLKPRVDFELVTEGEVLVVRASLVYGAPPVAKIVSGRLVQLGGVTPRRIPDAEKALELSLREQLDVLLDRPLRLEGLDAGRFVERLHAWRRKHEDGASSEAVVGAVELEPMVQMHDGEPLLSFVGRHPNGESCSVPASVVLRAHLEGIEQVPLSSGGWGMLPKGWLATHASILEDYLSAREASQGGRSAGALLLETNLAELGLAAPAGVEDYAARLASRAAISLPPDLNATLRPYQREGVAWLQALRESGLGGILADDMGLGKTLQTLAVLTGRSLVVVPKSVLFNWRQELARFRPSLSVCVYHGPQRELDADASVVLTTYAILRMDQARLEQIEWDCIVLDEAQTIKNSDSQATQTAHAMRARFRLALTGTPIENRLEELWSEMQFANPGLLGGLASFKRRFIEPMERGDTAAYERLRRRIRPFVLRRMKTEVAPELPPKSEDVLWVELEPSERQVYDAILGDSRAKLGESKQDAGARSVMEHPRDPIAAAASLLPLGSASRSNRRNLVQNRTSLRVTRGGHRRGAKGDRLFPMDQPARSGATGARGARDHFRATRRCDARSPSRRHAIPGGLGLSCIARFPQGGRNGAQPYGGRSRLSFGPLVEPRRRGAGSRSRSSHRQGSSGFRASTDCARHGGRASSVSPRAQASPRAIRRRSRSHLWIDSGRDRGTTQLNHAEHAIRPSDVDSRRLERVLLVQWPRCRLDVVSAELLHRWRLRWCDLSRSCGGARVNWDRTRVWSESGRLDYRGDAFVEGIGTGLERYDQHFGFADVKATLRGFEPSR
ncbi:MAG: SNF2-related protein [Polyangiaceae bacterium]